MMRSLVSRRVGVVSRLPARAYNFGSPSYLACFGDLPIADGAALRRDTIAYLGAFEPKTWYEDPVASIVNGVVLDGGALAPTVDAFAHENGRIRVADAAGVAAIAAHMGGFAPRRDYRAGVRAAEAELFAAHADALIGNQALDYRKQDGVTEIEESVQANLVERRLNDALLADETAGAVRINRAPAYVACVSNFSNFLDLSRKTLRNVEVGVPVVVLRVRGAGKEKKKGGREPSHARPVRRRSRSNTTQHCYRWFQILLALFETHGVDVGLLTYEAGAGEGGDFNGA